MSSPFASLLLSSAFLLLLLTHSSSSSLVPPISRSTCTLLASYAAAPVPVAATNSFSATVAEKQSVPSGAPVGAFPSAKAAAHVLDKAVVAGGRTGAGAETSERDVEERKVRSSKGTLQKTALRCVEQNKERKSHSQTEPRVKNDSGRPDGTNTRLTQSTSRQAFCH